MEKFYYKVKVAYNGSSFNGWQIQKSPQRTIQGELYSAFKRLCKSDDIKITGAGRTDAGVHAVGQIFKVITPLNLPCKAILKGLNPELSPAIHILDVSISDKDFRPINHSYWKEYNYLFCIGGVPGPFLHHLMSFCPYDLDLALMNEACKIFIGTHDFSNFHCTGSLVHSTKRTIFACEIIEKELSGFLPTPLMERKYYVFRVVGNGFLKQMVRLMMGALWAIGKGKCSLEELREALRTPSAQRLGMVAPPQGLYLKEVNYLQPFNN